jgi:hypothetical protein
MHQAAKAYRNCREGIARTGSGLDGHPECAAHQCCCTTAAQSKYAGVKIWLVVEEGNARLAHLYEFDTLVMSHLRLEQI